MRRRTFLSAVAATASVGAVQSVSSSAAASQRHDWRVDGVGTDSDAEIRIEFDREWLERYQPYLSASPETRRNAFTLCGYKVTSAEYQFDWACYWLRLAVQDGAAIGDFVLSTDSHLGDHEPLLVAVDKHSGEVDRFVYTAYHHFAGEIRAADATMQTHRAGFPTHGTFRVIDPWHHYSHASSPGGSLFDLENWIEKRDRWIDNGFYEGTAAEAVEDPEVMLTRSSWWEEDTLDYRFGRLFHRLGFGGGGEADDLKGD